MIEIRPYRDEDLPAVREFYSRAFSGDQERKVKAFEWIQSGNPRRTPEYSYLLCFDDGRLVGYWGLMPQVYYLRGTPVPICFSQEALVDPLCRGRGIAKKLMEAVNGTPCTLFSLWHNEKIVSIKTSHGWEDHGRVTPLKKMYRYGKPVLFKLQKLFGGVDLDVRPRSSESFSFACPVHQGAYRVDLVERCGEEFDALFHRMSTKYGVIGERTAAILNWKYIDIPHKKYHVLAARQGGQLAAYAVVNIEEQGKWLRKASVIDLLGDPEDSDAVGCLARLCDAAFRAGGVDFGVCLVQEGPLKECFRQVGYEDAKPRQTASLLLYNKTLGPFHPSAPPISEWYVTTGESDADMW